MTVYQKRALLLTPIIVAVIVANARYNRSVGLLALELAIVAWFIRRG